MPVALDEVVKTVQTFLVRTKKYSGEVSDDLGLYAGGIGLDSLEAAELSAVLEDKLGTDPFSAGKQPATVGDILDFYR